MQGFSREQVLAMAPDPASAKAGQGQAARARWPSLGHDGQAVWGECRGSGARPYQCQAALADGASKCSCPSRKFPCKHAIGLLLLLAGDEVPAARCPSRVTEWLASRTERAAKRAVAASPPGSGSAPADPDAAGRRAASRDKKVDAGVAELSRWLADLADGGLASAPSRSWQWWDQVARRMIDAQARGLANRVRRLAEIAAASGQLDDWPARMLDEIGALHLLCEAWTRRESLPVATALALRTRIGFAAATADVAAAGRRVTDTWAVLGQRQADEGQLRTLQQWLYGERTGEVVTYLAFAAGSQSLEPGLPPGLRSLATVAVYPGSVPARVLIAERHDRGEPLGVLPGSAGWEEALAGVADLMAVDPWADVVPLAVRAVTVLPAPEPRASGSRAVGGARGSWLLRDRAGRVMPVGAPPEVRWRLLALSGGSPVDVAGEWDGFAFSPQAAAVAGEYGQLIA
jgi:hypothetical protein